MELRTKPMPNFTYNIVVPARYESTRLPGKPLKPIAGKPMIQHVYENAQKSKALKTVVATDDERILEKVQSFGGSVRMTSRNHTTGTDRISEVSNMEGWQENEIVVNVQGDEPLLPHSMIDVVAEDLFTHRDASISSLCTPIKDIEDFRNPNVVKVVLDKSGFALYFSRSPIPSSRSLEEDFKSGMPVYRHIGLYAYRVGFLKEFSTLKPCNIEEFEKLEQLRALYYGHKIHMKVISEGLPPGVDTNEDLIKVQAIMEARANK